MKFDVSALSPDIRESVHHFEGDGRTAPIDYRRAMFAGYVSSVSTLYGVAMGCELDLDSETFERWKRFGATAGLADDYLDESGDIRVAAEHYHDGLSRVLTDSFGQDVPPAQHDLLIAAGLLRNSVQYMPEATQQDLLQVALDIGGIALQKAACTEIDAYISTLRREAELTARLVIDTASPYVQSQEGFDLFGAWCHSALEFATLGDSLRDLWSDAVTGRTGVAPSLPNALHILRQLVPPLRRLYRPAKIRHASVRGVLERLRFSALPTKLAMQTHQDYPVGTAQRSWSPLRQHKPNTSNNQF